MEICEWFRKFDGHFTMSCTNETGERANGNWKPDKYIKETKYNFKFCPYCGGKIIAKHTEKDKKGKTLMNGKRRT